MSGCVRTAGGEPLRLCSSSMWVFIVTLGTRGDVQPYVYLAAGLVNRGHRVTLSAEDVHRPLVEGLLGSLPGVDFVGLLGDNDALQRTEKYQRLLAKRDVFNFMMAVQDVTEKNYLDNGHRLLKAITREQPTFPTVMVINVTPWTVIPPIAESLKIPLVVAPFMPLAFPAPDFAPIAISPRPLPFAFLNLLAQKLVISIITSTVGNKDDIRKFQEECQAPLLSPRELLLERFLMLPYAFLFPSILLPLPQAWSKYHIDQCGALNDRLLPSSSTTFQPIKDPRYQPLLDFLAAGGSEGPVFISFGSMVGVRQDLARLATRALMLSGRRGIIQRGWGGMSLSQLKSEDPDDAELLKYASSHVLELDYALPHSWLFPQCSVIVHHGGCGTTSTALYAGTPQVVLPILNDQPFFAERVGVCGVGPRKWVSLYDVTAEQLCGLIQEAFKPQYKTKAIQVKAMVEEEDGVMNTIKVIEREGEVDGEVFWARVKEEVEEDKRQGVRKARMKVIVMITVVVGGGTLLIRRILRRR